MERDSIIVKKSLLAADIFGLVLKSFSLKSRDVNDFEFDTSQKRSFSILSVRELFRKLSVVRRGRMLREVNDWGTKRKSKLATSSLVRENFPNIVHVYNLEDAIYPLILDYDLKPIRSRILVCHKEYI
jgi:hypothetical protein